MADRGPAGLSRRPEFGATAEDRLLGVAAPLESPRAAGARSARGASGASPVGEAQRPARRRPLKVDEALAAQVHDAVLFLRGRGRPELTQNELIDELLADGLERVRGEANGGDPFPISARRGRARTP
jgi:hypothetical protein